MTTFTIMRRVGREQAPVKNERFTERDKAERRTAELVGAYHRATNGRVDFAYWVVKEEEHS